MWGVVLGQFYIWKIAAASKKRNAQADICRHKKIWRPYIQKEHVCLHTTKHRGAHTIHGQRVCEVHSG